MGLEDRIIWKRAFIYLVASFILAITLLSCLGSPQGSLAWEKETPCPSQTWFCGRCGRLIEDPDVSCYYGKVITQDKMREILHSLYERYPNHQFTITAEDVEAEGTVTYPNGTIVKFFIKDGREWPPYERIPEGSEFFVKVHKLRLIEILDHGVINMGDMESSSGNAVVPKVGPFP